MITPKFKKFDIEAYKPGKSKIKKLKKIVKLSANESALGMSPKVIKIISNKKLNLERYPDGKSEILRKEISKKYDVIGIHAFTTDGDVDAYSRNFAPIVGIDEESATGTSNGALSCYLYKYVNKKNKYILRQGFSMGLPSEIKSELKVVEDEIIDVFVGGKAKII